MIPHIEHSFTAPIWLYQGQGAWYFVTLPVDVATNIRRVLTGPRRGWGSVRVSVTIGNTTWKTSIFPSKELQSFILPLKLAVRKAEGLELEKNVTVMLVVLK